MNLVNLRFNRNRCGGDRQNKLAMRTARKIRKEIQGSGAKPRRITCNFGKLNWHPFAGVYTGEIQAIEIDRTLKFDWITEESARPPIERVFQQILQLEANLAGVIPD